MFIDVHIVATEQLATNIATWDVLTVKGGELIGVIERIEGPKNMDELASYWFTDTFGHSKEFDTIYEARDYAEQSINPATVN